MVLISRIIQIVPERRWCPCGATKMDKPFDNEYLLICIDRNIIIDQFIKSNIAISVLWHCKEELRPVSVALAKINIFLSRFSVLVWTCVPYHDLFYFNTSSIWQTFHLSRVAIIHEKYLAWGSVGKQFLFKVSFVPLLHLVRKDRFQNRMEHLYQIDTIGIDMICNSKSELNCFDWWIAVSCNKSKESITCAV